MIMSGKSKSELYQLCCQHRLESQYENIVNALKSAFSDNNRSNVDQEMYAEILSSGNISDRENFQLVNCELPKLRRELAKFPPVFMKEIMLFRRRLMSRRYFMKSIQRKEEVNTACEKEYQVIQEEIHKITNDINQLQMQVDSIDTDNRVVQDFIRSIIAASTSSSISTASASITPAGGTVVATTSASTRTGATRQPHQSASNCLPLPKSRQIPLFEWVRQSGGGGGACDSQQQLFIMATLRLVEQRRLQRGQATVASGGYCGAAMPATATGGLSMTQQMMAQQTAGSAGAGGGGFMLTSNCHNEYMAEAAELGGVSAVSRCGSPTATVMSG